MLIGRYCIVTGQKDRFRRPGSLGPRWASQRLGCTMTLVVLPNLSVKLFFQIRKVRKPEYCGMKTLSGMPTMDKLRRFTWRDVIEDAGKDMPVLLSVLQTVFPAQTG